MLEIHANALTEANVVYHEFLLRYRVEASTVYALVEGKEDPLFYRCHIERHLPNDWEVDFIKCGSKVNVLRSLREFDWSRFPKERICFFVDRDLSNFLNDLDESYSNLYVTDQYSVENFAVSFGAVKALLEDVLGVSDATPGEYQRLSDHFASELERFRVEFLPIMSQILLWRRAGEKANLNNINPKNFFVCDGGRFTIRPEYKRRSDRIKYAAKCAGGRAAPMKTLASAESEFQSLDGATQFTRGKYLFWFLVQFTLDVHSASSEWFSKYSTPPKKRISIGLSNAMVVIAPRTRCPSSLTAFIARNYLTYIDSRATSGPGSGDERLADHTAL